MTTLTVSEHTDYTVAPASSLVNGQEITVIEFDVSNTFFAKAWFSASQFGGSNISNSVLIQSNSAANQIEVWDITFNFSAAGWTFSNWTSAGNGDWLHLIGGNFSDLIIGSSVNDRIVGVGGADILYGGDGNDSFYVRAGEIVAGDLMDGGNGTDALVQTDGIEDFRDASITGIESFLFLGSETHEASFNANQLGAGLISYIQGNPGTVQKLNVYGSTNLADVTFSNWGAEDVITLRGSGASEDIYGSSQADTLDGGAGNDTMAGGLGDDTYVIDSLSDIIQENPGEGTDTLQVGFTYSGRPTNVEIVQLTGNAAIDLTGSIGADILRGNNNTNTILGGVGADVIVGQGGKDLMTGGAGLDRMVLESLSDSGITFAQRDVINTFAHGDKIDVSAIDAKTTVAGDQAFVFVSAFTGVAGQLQWDLTNVSPTGVKGYLVQGDVNGDSNADFSLQIYTAPTQSLPGGPDAWNLASWDFVL